MSCWDQQRRFPPEEWWRVQKKNDVVREEILRDRKAAIESGRLRGRRLFWGLEESELLESVSSYGSGNYFGTEEDDQVVVLHGGDCSFSGSRLSDEKVQREKVVSGGNVGVKRDGGVSNGGRRRMVFMGWFSVALIVFALAIIIKCNGGHWDAGGEVILVVPT